VCDWNADGQRDILVGDRNGYTLIFRETGSGLVLHDTLCDNTGVNIMVNYNSNPDVVDWNGDGRKDLIIGEQDSVAPSHGNLRLYINIGTNAAPVFNTYSLITCGGVQIKHYRLNPRVFDLDRDGKKDLLVGEDNGRIYFYRNTGTNNSPAFSTKDSLFLNTGTVLDMYYGSRFCIVDWKGDGDYDILGSDYDGFIYYFENATIVGAEEHEGSGALSALVVSPNPARGRVTIEFDVAEPGKARCDVYSVDGRRVATPFDRWENTGPHRGSWDLSELAAGVYLVKVTANGETLTRTVLVTR
jgi:hypothetical protein